MARLLWLPGVLRAAGLTVHEVGGWRERGGDSFAPRGVICHETRGSVNSTDAGEIRVLIEGSNTAPPPIAQLYLSRSGAWHVVASGRCNHVRVGQAGPFKGVGNTNLLGIEAQHAGGEAWTATQYNSYVRGVAAILRHTGWPAPVGHKEHQPGEKTDPAFGMAQFRADVAAVSTSGGDDVSVKDVQDALLGAGWGKPLYDGQPNHRGAEVILADLVNHVLFGKATYGGGKNEDSFLIRKIREIVAAEVGKVSTRISAEDLATLIDGVAEKVNTSIGDTVLGVLNSEKGQEAIVRAANTAETR